MTAKLGFIIYVFIYLLVLFVSGLLLTQNQKKNPFSFDLELLFASGLQKYLSESITQGRWHSRIWQKLLSQHDLSWVWNPPKTLFYVSFSYLLQETTPSLMPIPTLCIGQTNPNNHQESHQWEGLLVVWERTQQYGQCQETWGWILKWWLLHSQRDADTAGRTAGLYFVTLLFVPSLADFLCQARSSHLAPELYKWQRNSPSAISGKNQFSLYSGSSELAKLPTF